MERRLADRDYLASEYSIADMAAFPWVSRHERQGQDLNDYPILKRWYDSIAERDAVKRGLAVGADLTQVTNMTSDESKKILFGQKDK